MHRPPVPLDPPEAHGLPRRQPRWALLAVLATAIVNLQCDLVSAPEGPTYGLEAVWPAGDTVNVGDTLGEPAVRLLVNQREANTRWQISVVEGADVIRVDSVHGLIVEKPGIARVRVKPLNTAIPDTVSGVEFFFFGAVPRLDINLPDTIYSLTETVTLSATGRTRGGVEIPNVAVNWSIQGADTAAKLVTTAPMHLLSQKNGQVTVVAQADTARRTKVVHVKQKAVALTMGAAGVTLTGGTAPLALTATDAKGNAIVGPSITCTSLNPDVATVNASTCVVTAVATGQSVISATSGTVAAQALVTVAVPALTPVNLWAPMNSNTGNTLHAVWGTTASNVFAVGQGGVIRRFDGSNWNIETPNTTEDLFDVWGLSGTNVFAVGNAGTIRQFNGSAWNVVTAPNTQSLASVWGSAANAVLAGSGSAVLSNASGSFAVSQALGGPSRSIWGSASNNVYSVGSSAATVVRFDGGSWSASGLPTGEFLNGIWGTSPTHIWAVGGTSVGKALSFNGTAWQTTTLTVPILEAVWGTSASDVYAVGRNGAIVRFDGTAWVTMSSGRTDDLHGVWGVGNHVFVVGAGGVILRGYRGASVSVSPGNSTKTALGVTQQYTSSVQDAGGAAVASANVTWSSSNTAVATITAQGLLTTVADGTTNVCATAPGGAQGCSALIVAEDKVVASVVITRATPTATTFTASARNAAGGTITGKTFTWASLNPAVAIVNSSGAVTSQSAGQAVISATTDGVTGFALFTVIMPSSSGVNLWSQVGGVTPNDLFDVWGSSAASVFAVGRNGTILRNTGSGWTPMTSNTGLQLNAVWGTSATNVYAVGAGGIILRFNGTSWSQETSNTDKTLHAIWGSAPNDIWAAGDQRTLVHFNGSAWSVVQSSATQLNRITAIWGDQRVGVWARGDGVNLKFDGAQWNQAAQGAENSLTVEGMWGSQVANVWSVGVTPIQRFDGTNWAPFSSPGVPSLFGVWGLNENEVFAVGGTAATGAVVRFDGTSWSAIPGAAGANTLRGVWGTTNADVHVVGNAGEIWRGVRGATVTIAPANPVMAPGTQSFLQLVPTAKDGAQVTIPGVINYTWTSSDQTKVSVSQTGNVNAIAEGSANICATAPGGAQGCTSVTVSAAQAITTVSVTPAGSSITAPATVTLTASALNATGQPVSGTTFIWASLNPNVATVDASTGVVTSVAAGQAIISATASGVAGHAVVTVSATGLLPVNVWAPMTSGITTALQGVWGTSASNVFAVGENGVIRRFDGSAWSAMTSNTATQLIGVWGTSATDVYAFGSGSLLRFDGSTWNPLTFPSGLNDAAWGSAPNNVYIGGFERTLSNASGSFQIVNTHPGQIFGMWGFSANNIYAANISVGAIMRYTGGTSWGQEISPDGPVPKYGVWGSSPTNIFASGEQGKLIQSNGSTWSAFTSPTTQNLHGIWGTGPADVYSVGNAGVIVRYDGSNWALTSSGTTSDLYGIWGIGNDVFVVGVNGVILRGHRGATVVVNNPAPAMPLSSAGQARQLTATANQASNAQGVPVIPNVSFTWSSSNTNVATVNASGLVTAVANGTANVCATAPGGAQGCTTVTVNQVVASIAVSPAGGVVAGGATTTFTAVARDANNGIITGRTFSWQSSNPNVATIGASSGIATPVSAGQTTISATADGVTAQALLTVSMPEGTAVNMWQDILPALTNVTLRGVWAANPSAVFAVGDNGTILRFNGTTWSAMTSNTTQVLRGVWGTSPNDVFVTGDNGTILRFDGTTWTALSSGTTEQLFRIWGTSSSDVYAVGGNGTVLRFDGSTWTAMTSNTTSALIGIWGTSINDIFAVGNSGTIMHFDGSTWSQMSSGVTASLQRVWGTSSTDVFVTGDAGTILRYNGSTWSAMTSNTTQALRGIWGTSSSDLYVNGAGGVILRFDGSVWTVHPTYVGTFLGLWGTGSEVWGAGTNGHLFRAYRGGTVELTMPPTLTAFGATQNLGPLSRDAANAPVANVPFTYTTDNAAVATVSATGLLTAVSNGTTTACAIAAGGAQDCTTVTVDQAAASIVVTPGGASIMSGTSTFTATAQDANNNAIAGQAFTWSSLNTNVATVSSSGVVTGVASGQATIAATADGVSGYAIVSVAITASPVNLWVPMASGTTNDLNGVWGTSSTNVFAVGLNGTILHYNGTSWTAMTSGTAEFLTGVWGSSGTDVWAVGDDVILHYNGSTWTPVAAPVGVSLYKVWGTAPNNVFAIGGAGRILHYTGSAWTEMSSGSTQTLRGIWGATPVDIFAVGYSGTILRFGEGTGWTAMSSPVTQGIEGVWGISTTDVFAAAYGEAKLLRFNGTNWTAIASPKPMWALTGSSPSDVYIAPACSPCGVLRFDGTTVSEVAGTQQGNNFFEAIWSAPGGDVFVTGDNGTIVRGLRGATVSVTPSTPTITSIGGTQQMTAVARDASNNAVSGATFTWSSTTPGVATVSVSGMVTAVAQGTTNVCATAPGGVQGCTTVTVDQAAAAITVTPGGASISTGTTTFTATAMDANNNTIPGQTFTWTSLNIAVATVGSSTGTVSPINSGQATIAATADGVSGFAVVTVSKTGTPPVNLWAVVPSPTNENLWDVWAADVSNVFAVGNAGVVLRYNGATWSQIDNGNTVLNAVWGTSGSNVHAVGTVLRRFNGTTWSTAAGSVPGFFQGVWGASPNDVFATSLEFAGSNTKTYLARFNGSAWQRLDSATVPIGSTAPLAMWGSSSTNVFTAFEGGVLRRWNGSTWTSSNVVTSADLFGITGVSENDLFIAAANGAGRTILQSTNGGQSWTPLPSIPGLGAGANAIWAASTTELWVATESAGYVARYNGSSWDTVHTGGGKFLRGITGTSGGDVWAVGLDGSIVRGVRGATITVTPGNPTLTSIGATQQMTATPKDAVGAPIAGTVPFTWSSSNNGVATVSSTGLITTQGPGTTSICATANATGNAQGCTTVTVDPPAASITISPNSSAITSATQQFTAEARDAANNVLSAKTFTWASTNPAVATVTSSGLATGVRSGQTTISASADGVTSYSLLTVGIANTAPPNLWISMNPGLTVPWTGIWGTTESDVFIVGDNGAIRRFNGTTWGGMNSNTTSPLNAIGGTGPNDLWAAGVTGTLRHFNGSTWDEVAVPFTGNGVWAAAPNAVHIATEIGVATYNGSGFSSGFNGSAEHRALWGSAANNIYVVANDATTSMRRFNGSVWDATGLPTGHQLFGIWGSSPTNIFAVGLNNTVLRFDGSWSSGTFPGAAQSMFGVWGTGVNDVYAVGNNGKIARFNGASWSELTTGITGNLRGVWGADNSLFVTSLDGAIYRGFRNATVTVTPGSPTIPIGGTLQMTATARDAANATISGATVTWSSNDENVATVSASGLVTAVADGSASICATAPGGAQGCTTVTTGIVFQGPAAISIKNGSTHDANLVVIPGGTSGVNRLLMCVVGTVPSIASTAVSSVVIDDGAGGGAQSLSALGGYNNTGGSNRWSTWFLVGATTGGTRRIRVTFNEETQSTISCVNYAGVDQGNPLATANVTSGSTGSASNTITSNKNGSLPWAHLVANGGNYSAGAGVTDRHQTNDGVLVDGNTKIANLNSHTFNWSYSGSFFSHAVMIRPAGP